MRSLPLVKSPAIQLSTWPFADGFAWDEELIRNGARALSTHGRYEAPALSEPEESSPGSNSGAAIESDLS